MDKQRILSALVLLPVGLAAIFIGSWPLLILVSFLLGFAAWEFGRLFKGGDFHPSSFFLVAGVLIWLWVRHFFSLAGDPFGGDVYVTTLAVLFLMAYYVIAYERGDDKAGTDFSITLSGILYLGGLGSFIMLLRSLPDGQWWFLIIMPSVWLADTGAFYLGRLFGRHKFSPRLSPKKTWEGYFGGLLASPLLMVPFFLLWERLAGHDLGITIPQVMLVALFLAAVTPVGDLGESMFKRQFGVKDSGTLLPGHGGALDRIDSWLWGAAIGYFIVTVFFI